MAKRFLPSIGAVILILLSASSTGSGALVEGKPGATSDKCPANVIPFPHDTDLNYFSSNCSCNCSSIPGFITKCSNTNNNYSIQLLHGYCVTLSNGSVIVGECPYGSRKWAVENQLYYDFQYNDILTNKSMCDAINRTGPLCAHCKEGHGMALYSNSWACKNCTLSSGVSWALYLTLETVPVSFFFLMVIFFNIKVTSPPMTGLVFISQLLISASQDEYMRESLIEDGPISEPIVRIALTFYGVWNLDFFRELVPEFCVSPHLSNTEAVALRYISTLCPLLLVLISVVCIKLHDRNFRPIVYIWRPVHRCLARYRRSWNPNASIVDALATFLLLSYSTTLLVTFNLSYSITVYVLCGDTPSHNMMYIDGSKAESVQSFIPTILVSSLFIFPPLLLTFYQTKVFKKLLTIVRLDSWPPLHMFVEQFQGHYKDGTEGTYDYRFLSGIYLIFRIIFVLPFGYTLLSDGSYLLICVLLFLSATLFQALVQPYKKRYMNVLESLIFALCLLVVLLHLCYLYLPPQPIRVAVIGLAVWVLVFIPMCVFWCYLLYKFIHYIYKSEWFLRKVTRRRGPGAEDGALEYETLNDSFADRLEHPCRYYGAC